MLATKVLKINCENCTKDLHDDCQNENCLCRENNHGVKIPTLKDGVTIDNTKPIPKDIPKERNGFKYHCFSCDKEAITANELRDCYDLRHEVMKVIDENYHGDTQNKKDKKQRQDDISTVEILYRFAKLRIKKTVVSSSDSNQIFAKIQNNEHIETIDLTTTKAKRWLLFNYKQATNQICAADSYKNALDAIKSDALFNGTTRETIFLRIAQTDDAIYYDLCSPKWELIKITKSGVTTIPYDENTPTFIRKQAMVEQVKPKFEGRNALEELVNLLRVEEDDKIVFQVHLACLFYEKFETPLAVILGEHGSSKTTFTKTMKRIVDPSVSNIGSLPTRKEDLPQIFQNNYSSVFDNVSGLKQATSDAICRAITGDQSSKRQLYTDNDDFIYQYERKISLNGISPRIDSADLIDRTIFYEIPHIPDNERLTKEEFNRKIDELMPHILGQIFTTLSKTLENYDKIGKNIRPFSRMGEFEKYGETISRILGHKENEFLDRYKEKWLLGSISAIDAFPIIGLIQTMMENTKVFVDTVSNLHKKLKADAKDLDIETKGKESGFPTKPNLLSRQLKQLTPTFSRLGLMIKIIPYDSRDNKYPRGSRIIHITNEDFKE